MNILLYLQKNINFTEKTKELLNIVCSWKKSSKGKVYIAVSEDSWLHLKKDISNWDIDKVFLLKEYEDSEVEETALFFKKILKEEEIHCIVMGNSIFERELAPYLSAVNKWRFVPNIINFEIRSDSILWKRFLYGTKAVEEFSIENKNFVATISSNIYKKDEREFLSKDIKTVEVELKGERNPAFIAVEARERKILRKHPLESAKIVVGVGKGIKGKENFPMMEELADLLGATIGVTRSVVDNGWRPEYEKIGQTGKIIKPELYLGFGISGAMQHMAGVQQSRHIIMVNSNPNAESFRSSDFGIVADLFDVVPKIIEFLKKKNQAENR